MIARKITYKGNFSQQHIGEMYDITRKNEITGLVKAEGTSQVVLTLEGDASMIKLIQHQIERKVKSAITDKTIEPIPYHNYVGVTFLL